VANLMAKASAWIAEQVRDHASDLVTYSRGQMSVRLLASGGPQPLRAEGDVGVRVEWANRDWLIAAADLVLGGNVVEPAKGDVIRLDDATGATHVYQVLALPGEAVWRWSDAHNVLRRVHSKYVGTE